MCHKIKVRHPDRVLAEGTHAGHEWLVVHNTMGFRCGYVKVDPGHPWYQKNYDDIECSVHGGLTFAEADVTCDKGGPDEGWWIGFDAAHCDDGFDPSLPVEDGRITESFGKCWDGKIKDNKYMEDECKRLAEQAQQAASQ